MTQKNYSSNALDGLIIGLAVFYAVAFSIASLDVIIVTTSTFFNNSFFILTSGYCAAALSFYALIKSSLISTVCTKDPLIPKSFLCLFLITLILATAGSISFVTTPALHWNDDVEGMPSYLIHFIFGWIIFFIPPFNLWAAFKSKRLFYTLLPISIYLALSFALILTPFRFTLRPVSIFIYEVLRQIQHFLT
jgi:hypothetical protein